VARRSNWRSFIEVRSIFSDADQYRNLLIFHIRHNTYRLVVKVDDSARLLMIKAFLTQKQYERGEWKKWAR
jgi:mRNA interferase HigB